MSKVLMVSEQYVKDNTVIDDNVDVKLLKSTIYDCQRDYILPILGSKLYDKIVADITAGTITGVYKTLLDDYISEALVKWVMYESVPTLTYKFRNKSVAKKSSDNALPISYAELKAEMDRWRDKAELRSQDITNYLCVNSSQFPEYNQVGYGDVPPQKNNYTTSIYLGGTGTYTSKLEWLENKRN